jgi:hypothetical protein
MNHRVFFGVFLAGWMSVCLAEAATVQLELVGDRSAAGAFQEWGKALDKAGIPDVRIRSGSGEELKPKLETLGTADRPIYGVTGVVVSKDEISLPGGRYKRNDLKRLKSWLDDLAKNGPADKRPAKVAFGLTQKQCDELRKSLASPTAVATAGVERREAVKKVLEQSNLSLKFDEGSLRDLGDDQVEDDLSMLTCGTSLAALLRPAGYCLVPKLAGDKVELTVVKSKSEPKEIWPVGSVSDKSIEEVLPKIIEYLPVNVQNVSAATAAEAIAKRLEAPILYDRVALARHGIDPAKAMVSMPKSKTTYGQALRRLLSKAGLQYEVREDESGKPFLWISTIKPI